MSIGTSWVYIGYRYIGEYTAGSFAGKLALPILRPGVPVTLACLCDCFLDCRGHSHFSPTKLLLHIWYIWWGFLRESSLPKTTSSASPTRVSTTRPLNESQPSQYSNPTQVNNYSQYIPSYLKLQISPNGLFCVIPPASFLDVSYCLTIEGRTSDPIDFRYLPHSSLSRWFAATQNILFGITT